MPYSTVRTISYRKRGYGYARPYRSRYVANRAAFYLRRRMGGYSRAPLSTRGYIGSYGWLRRGKPELKYTEADDGAAAGIPTAGEIFFLNPLQAGTGITDRIGRKCMMKSLLLRLGLYPSTTNSAPSGTIVRALIVYDAQNNSSAAGPNVSDILMTATWDSSMNLDNRERFKILWEKMFTVAATTYTTGALSAGSPRPIAYEKWRKMNLPVIFSGVGAGTADIATGAVYMLLIANINNTVVRDWRTRIRFTDE